MDKSPYIRTETIETSRGDWGLLCLDRPKALNALSLDMIVHMQQQLDEWANREDILGVVLHSSSERAFCAGGDVKQVAIDIQKGDIQDGSHYFGNEYRLDASIHLYSKPIIAWMDGYVMGGGVGLGFGADFRIITPGTQLSMPEVRIGFFPDVGASLFLGRMPLKMGLIAGWTAHKFSPKEILQFGLADFQLFSHQKIDFFDFLSETAWSLRPEENRRLLKQWFLERHQSVTGELETIPLQGNSFSELHESLEKYEPQSPQKKQEKQIFLEGSPTSKALIYLQMEWAKQQKKSPDGLGVKKVFEMEYQLAIRQSRHFDFIQGVKSLLIDKDNQPLWRPIDLTDLPWEELQSWFKEPITSPLFKSN